MFNRTRIIIDRGIGCHFGDSPHFPADTMDSIRYKCVLVLKKKALPETAGDAMKPLASVFVAKTSNARPGLRTAVAPC